MNTNGNKKKRIDKILDILKSWKGKQPDYENSDLPKDDQSEEVYQEEQAKWLKEVKRKKAEKKENKDL